MSTIMGFTQADSVRWLAVLLDAAIKSLVVLVVAAELAEDVRGTASGTTAENKP